MSFWFSKYLLISFFLTCVLFGPWLWLQTFKSANISSFALGYRECKHAAFFPLQQGHRRRRSLRDAPCAHLLCSPSLTTGSYASSSSPPRLPLRALQSAARPRETNYLQVPLLVTEWWWVEYFTIWLLIKRINLYFLECGKIIKTKQNKRFRYLSSCLHSVRNTGDENTCAGPCGYRGEGTVPSQRTSKWGTLLELERDTEVPGQDSCMGEELGIMTGGCGPGQDELLRKTTDGRKFPLCS